MAMYYITVDCIMLSFEIILHHIISIKPSKIGWDLGGGREFSLSLAPSLLSFILFIFHLSPCVIKNLISTFRWVKKEGRKEDSS